MKDRPQLILPEEIRVVEAALHRHPKGNNYRVAAKGKQIAVYERIGPDAEAMANGFGKILPTYSRQGILDGMGANLDKKTQHSSVLQFNLVDAATCTICVESKKWGRS